jgi:hypothetical protein
LLSINLTIEKVDHDPVGVLLVIVLIERKRMLRNTET